MPKGNIIVTGDKDLDKRLSVLTGAVQKKVARKGLRKAGKLIQQHAKANLSRNSNVDTGELRRGIRVRSMKRSRTRIGIEVGTTERREASRGGFRFGGAQLETGTKYVEAKPFLRPAAYDREGEIRGLISESINEALDELARSFK